ncbi:hypothetical protein N7513_003191 [Penicillium frequentans]|nr:hypothetical protein N7513_003191 [Penicillium glabrum]
MEAKTVHFSDWPVPKPWVNFPSNALDEHKPPCHWNATSGEEDDCRDRDVWLGMYYDFNTRRMVCGFAPARFDTSTDRFRVSAVISNESNDSDYVGILLTM